MKANYLLIALAMGAAVAACSPKAEQVAEGQEGTAAVEAAEAQPAPAPAEKSTEITAKEINDVSYLLGINFGSFLKGYNFGKNLNFREIVKGMKDFVNSKGDMQDEGFTDQFKVNPETMNEVFNNYLEKRQAQVLDENKKEGEKFLAKMDKKAGVVKTESGLRYQIVTPGTDVKAGPMDTVYVLYKGSLIDGTVFDQTEEGAEPMALCLNHVIAGWTEGLQLVGEGGEINLYIPYDLAYGERGNRSIEPCKTLIFNVQISKVGKFVAPVAEEAAE